MHVVMFYHSLISDWNHGNAHFLRGVVSELLSRGHTVDVYEPNRGWSLINLIKAHGQSPLLAFRRHYPHLKSHLVDLEGLNLDQALSGADLVIVHEWNEHDLVRRIGRHRARHRAYRLLFHDTHHRSVTEPESMAAYDLSHYDGALAFGQVIRDIYLDRGWAQRAWTWHEGADIRAFHPIRGLPEEGDLVWIGNWGDDERTKEYQEFLFEPAKALGLKGRAYGVRYPAEGRKAMEEAGLTYRGWLPNFRVPQIMSSFKVTVHIPRRSYSRELPGIPTIRVFEALACGIPLVCAPWRDTEGLFEPGKDFMVAENGREMKDHLHTLITRPDLRREMAQHGLKTIINRHTCAHRVEELLDICQELGVNTGDDSHSRRSLSEVAVNA